MPTSIKELLRQEQQQRKAQKWLQFAGIVKDDRGMPVFVRIKSYGLYLQIFKLGDSEVDHAAGHTLHKVSDLQKYVRDKINSHWKPDGPNCPECGRKFDLTNETDIDEWYHGHDCEPVA